MYLEHFHLKMPPFNPAPDIAFFFNDGEHADLYRQIDESLTEGQGMIAVTGPPGSGRTVLGLKIASDLRDEAEIIRVPHPPANNVELFHFIATELGLHPDTPIKTTIQKALLVREVEAALKRIHSEGRKCLLIIDNVPRQADDFLKGIRLLNNLEEGSKRLIQVLLLGEEGLTETINGPDMRIFREQVKVLKISGTISTAMIERYISHHMEVAGGKAGIFSAPALEAIRNACSTGATPREINSLCDTVLATAFRNGRTVAEADDVREALGNVLLGSEISQEDHILKEPEKEEEAVTEQPEQTGQDGLRSESPQEAPGMAMYMSKEEAGKKEPAPDPAKPVTARFLRDGSNGSDDASEDAQKDPRKRRFSSFVRRILGKDNGAEDGDDQDRQSLEDRKDDDREETVTEPVHKRTNAEAEEPLKPGRNIPAGTEKSGETERGKTEKVEMSGAQDMSGSSQWVTIDTKGVKPFQPVRTKEKKPADETVKKKQDLWLTPEGGKSGGRDIPDRKVDISLKADSVPDSSGWITVDTKGSKAFKAVHYKEAKSPGKEKVPPPQDEWVRRRATSD